MSNVSGAGSLIEAAIDQARVSRTGLGYDEYALKNLARVVIANWEHIRGAFSEATANLKAVNDIAEERQARAERLRLELEKIGWMDEFLDADGAKAMMEIARDAVNADEVATQAPALS